MEYFSSQIHKYSLFCKISLCSLWLFFALCFINEVCVLWQIPVCSSFLLCFSLPLSSQLDFYFIVLLQILYPVLAHGVGTSISLKISVPNSYLTVSILGILPRELLVIGFEPFKDETYLSYIRTPCVSRSKHSQPRLYKPIF